MSISATVNGQNALATTDPLPTAVEEITIVWCSKILGVEVTEAVIFAVRHGSSSTVAVDLTYGSEQIALPRRIYVKGGFNPQLIAVAPSLMGTYRREAEFYHDFAPSLNIRLPKTFYCGTSQTSGQGIVVMEDLRAKECTFGNPLELWPVAKVRLGIGQLAILHTKTWGSDKIQIYPWLTEANPLRGIVLELMVPRPFDVVATNLEPLGEKARVLTFSQL